MATAGFYTTKTSGTDETALPYRLSQGTAIDIFELASDRHAASDAADRDAAASEQFGNVMRRRFAFVRVVGCKNDFADEAIIDACKQLFQLQFSRTDAIEWRQTPHENVIKAVVGVRELHHIHVDRCFDNAEQRRIAPRRSAPLADIEFGEGIAAPAMLDRLQRCFKAFGYPPRPRPVVLQ